MVRSSLFEVKNGFLKVRLLGTAPGYINFTNVTAKTVFTGFLVDLQCLAFNRH